MIRAICAAAVLAASVGLPAFANEPPLAALSCGGCHGVGAKGSPPIDAIAGRPADQLVASLAAFRSNDKPSTIMGRIARGYTDAEIAAIAAWLAAQR
jgi:cytochrome c553